MPFLTVLFFFVCKFRCYGSWCVDHVKTFQGRSLRISSVFWLIRGILFLNSFLVGASPIKFMPGFSKPAANASFNSSSVSWSESAWKPIVSSSDSDQDTDEELKE